MRLFFDTNVLLDHALSRSTGQPLEIAYLMFWAEKHNIPVYISPGSLYTFTYVLQKNGVRGDDLKMKIEHYLSLLHLCASDRSYFLQGIRSSFKDTEDAFQYFHGVQAACDHLITCNVRDFKIHATQIRVFSPAQFLNQVLNKRPGIDF
nr:PIN domain-containing protein [uncultured Dyadobacter sp.]